MPHGNSDFLNVGLKRKVAGIKKLHGGVGDIAAKGLGARGDEVGVVLAPDGE